MNSFLMTQGLIHIRSPQTNVALQQEWDLEHNQLMFP